ncbi:PAS domain S-box protein [Microbacteriaceae bacterium 4G12]
MSAISDSYSDEYRKILDTLTDGIFTLDMEWNIIYANHAATHLLVRNVNSLIGRSFWEEFKEAENYLCYSQFHKAMDLQKELEFEEYYPFLQKWFHVKVFPSPNCLTVHFQNITSSKRLLDESIQYYKSLYENHPDMVFSLHSDGRFLTINHNFEKIMGYSGEELFMKPIHVLTNEPIHTFTCWQNEKLKSIETVLIRKNGQIIDVLITLTPIKIDDSIIGTYGIVKDLTESKSSQQEIERLNHMNQLILNSVAEGIYGIDLHANVIFWNKAAECITGFTQEELAGHDLHKLIHHTNTLGYFVPTEDCPINQSLGKGTRMFVTDDVFWKKDGTSFPVEYTMNPIFEKNKHVGTVITFRDITEKKRTEEILHESEKLSAIGQLAAGIAHEIRNPLTSLKGFLQFMQASSDFKKEYFEIMESEFERIESILSELLMVAKPQAKNFKKYEIKQIIYNVITLLETQAIMKNIQIITNFTEHPLIVDCVSNQLKQVFINLIKNAIESMDHGGDIIIEISKENPYALIRIIDQGNGIAKEKIEKLGQPFFSTKEKGTGLGLMVTYRIIENHYGSIFVESEENIGTTFTIRLPIIEE